MALQRSVTSQWRRFFGVRAVRRVIRDENGQAAVEFSLVAWPFFALLFAIIETSMMLFANATLETAVSDSSRLIMTGEAQRQGMNEARFRQEVCNRVVALFDCPNLMRIDVRSYRNFNEADLAPPARDGNLDPGQMRFQPGDAGDIVVVRLFYEWPLLSLGLGVNLANATNGSRLLVATASFRNEPFR